MILFLIFWVKWNLLLKAEILQRKHSPRGQCGKGGVRLGLHSFDDNGREHARSAFAPLNSTFLTTLSHIPRRPQNQRFPYS